MRFIAILLCLCALHAEEPFDFGSISEDQIEATIQHMQELNSELRGKLNTEKLAHDIAEVKVQTLQIQINKLTDDRNQQASDKDDAIQKQHEAEQNEVDAKAHAAKLVNVIASIITLIVAVGLLMVGLFKAQIPWGALGGIIILVLIFFGSKRIL